jgi:hypothetical protein
MKQWRVTLKSGETHLVGAINEWHAGSRVVYGSGRLKINAETGQAIGKVLIHRDNIALVELVK